MSNHERVWGTFVLPQDKYEEVKSNLFQLQQKEEQKLLSLAAEIYLKIKKPQKYQEFKKEMGDSTGYKRNDLMSTYIFNFISTQYSRLRFYENTKIQDLLLITGSDGKRRIRNPKTAKLHPKTDQLDIGREGKILFNDEKKTISVSIGENNHSYSYAKKVPIYTAFEKIVESMLLEQGFGGQLLYEGSYSNGPEVLKTWGPPPLTAKKQFKNSPY